MQVSTLPLLLYILVCMQVISYLLVELTIDLGIYITLHYQIYETWLNTDKIVDNKITKFEHLAKKHLSNWQDCSAILMVLFTRQMLYILNTCNKLTVNNICIFWQMCDKLTVNNMCIFWHMCDKLTVNNICIFWHMCDKLTVNNICIFWHMCDKLTVNNICIFWHVW